MWETFSLGQQPYVGRSNWDVLNYVRIGGRLSPPEFCPVPMYYWQFGRVGSIMIRNADSFQLWNNAELLGIPANGLASILCHSWKTSWSLSKVTQECRIPISTKRSCRRFVKREQCWIWILNWNLITGYLPTVSRDVSQQSASNEVSSTSRGEQISSSTPVKYGLF